MTQKAICRSTRRDTSSIRNNLSGEEKKARKQEGTLCEKCGGSGYKGRVAAYELLTMNRSIRESIKQKKSTQEIEQEAIQSGMITLKRYAVSLIEQQLTTISELQKMCSTEN